jgi:hypothetical protein
MDSKDVNHIAICLACQRFYERSNHLSFFQGVTLPMVWTNVHK